MFNEVGTKLKVTAWILFVLGLIGSVVLCIALFGESVLLGLLCGVASALGSWVSAMCIYALGDIADNIEYIMANGTAGSSFSTSKSFLKGKPAGTASDSKSVFSDDSMIMCPKCGKYQFADRAVCSKCGYRF